MPMEEPAVLSTFVVAHPLLTVAMCLTVLLLYSRLTTGIAYSRAQSRQEAGVRKPATLPYWIPYIGHTLPFITDAARFFGEARDESKDSVFAIQLAGYRANVVLMPSLVKQVFAQRKEVLHNHAFAHRAQNALGDTGTLKHFPEASQENLTNLTRLMTDVVVTDASNRTAAQVGEKILSLVSLSKLESSRQLWDKAARTQAIGNEEVETSFFELITRWTYVCSTPALLGEAFHEHCPSVMDDIFVFDEKFPLMLSGLPSFMLGASKSTAARNRSLEAVARWCRAYGTVLQSKDPGPGWGDMNDVSDVVEKAFKIWHKGGKDTETLLHSMIFGNLFALHTNAGIITFWMLSHIYSRPDVLASIRLEIAPYINTNGEVYDIDHTSLARSCPLLKSCYIETLRYDNIGAEFRSIEKDFVVTESQPDAVLLRGEGATPRSYILRKGESVFVPNGTLQFDRRLWSSDPNKFNPARFVTTKSRDKDQLPFSTKDDETAKTAFRETAEFPRQNLYVFGGGPTMCKGRLFAEREILTFTAAVIMFWDVEILGKRNKDNGDWEIKKGLLAGSPYPAEDTRVRLRRRKEVNVELGI